MTPEMRDALYAVGSAVSFADGEVLRERGAFAPDLLLITQGHVDCVLSDDEAVNLSVGPDTIVGEIGFLTGQGATATLRALGPVQALSLDAQALQRLRREAPTVAADVLRHLAQLLQKRTTQNEALVPDPDTEPGVEVLRCSTLDQKRTAQRVRYDVECLEEGIESPFSDHEEGIVTDNLDQDGTAFIAFTGVQAIGMMRVNLGADSQAIVQRFPALNGVPLEDAAVITASALHAAYRDAALYAQFFSAIRTFAEASGLTSVIAPCDPQAAVDYTPHGFRPVTLGNDIALLELPLSADRPA